MAAGSSYPAEFLDENGIDRLGGTLEFTDSTTQPTPAVSGAVLVTALAAPADGAIAAGQAFIWFDDTNGAGKLMVKAKTANGTVATGSVTLS